MAQLRHAEVAPRVSRTAPIPPRRPIRPTRPARRRRAAPMLRRSVDGPALLRAVRAAVANLEAHVEEVDALNVFPVPDGDTGSNMLATMRAALAEAERLPPDQRDLASVSAALSRGALTGARGNSGVILSQIIRGMTYGADGRRRADGQQLATGLRRGSEIAYSAVLSPVEGTILTVIRDAAAAAERAAGRGPHVETVLTQVIAAAADSVRRTPDLLPTLRDAGVVDSGGQGLYRLFEGMVQVDAPSTAADVDARGLEHRQRRPSGRAVPARERIDAPPPSAHAAGEHEHGYETEFLITAGERAIDVTALRTAITAIGDSVVVAGDESLVRVHVHGERPDAAIAAGLAWGRLSDVSVRDLDDQVAHSGVTHASRQAAHPMMVAFPSSNMAPPIALVAVSRADGLAGILHSLGAHVVRPAHGSRPSVGEMRDGILATGSGRVILLPNHRDAFLAARHAAEATPDVDVVIVPTRNAAEGIAAAVAFAADAPFAEVVARLQAEAAALRSFTVSVAARDAVVDGVPLARGRLIALDAGRRLLAHGERLEAVTVEALGRLGAFDLVTCYHGVRVDEAATELLREHIEAQGWEVELDMVAGGQRHDLLLVAVE